MLFSKRQLDSRSRFVPIGLAGPMLLLMLLLLMVASLPSPFPTASAQNLLSSEPSGTQYPSAEYYFGLEAYRDGDIVAASRLFDAALGRARLGVHGRWVDSIPSLAMLSECHWQLGSLLTAREHLDQAFQIATRSRGWLGRIEWQSISDAGVQSTRQVLWPEMQAVRVFPLKRRTMYRSGQPLTAAQLARGGVIEERTVRSIDAVEIMRGLAIAGYRRRIILGRLAENDSIATGLLESTKYPAGLQAPVPRALIGCVRSSGYFANGDDERSISNTTGSAMFNGSVHPLSAIAMLAAGSALAGSDKASESVADLISTVHIAAALGQPELVGETMQLAAGYANSKNATDVVRAAQIVSAAYHRRSTLASLHCWIAGADAAVTAGDLESATTMLGHAQSLTSRRDVVLPRLKAYADYVTARLESARGLSGGVGKVTAVDQALTRMTQFALNNRLRNQPLVSMPRVYQLHLVRQAIGKSVGGKTGDALLVSYCKDPPIDVWRRDPVNAISGAIVDRSSIHAARVNLAATEGYAEKFLVATDALLANRFNSRLPLGGRLSQIRFLARTADPLLDETVIKMRDKVGPLMKGLRASAAAMGQADREQLASLESITSQIGLRRNEIPHVMPPLLKQKLPVAKMPKRTGLLTFVHVGDKSYASLAIDGKVEMWNIAGSGRLASEVGRLLRGIGVGKTRGKRLSDDPSWRTAAVTLRRHLIPDDHQLSAERLDHLIVVPDGPLWYLPFELLPIDDEHSALIGDRIAVRYASTPGLALQMTAPSNTSRAIGIASGPFFAPKEIEQNQSIVQSINDVIEESVDLPEKGGLPSGLLGKTVGHFVVAAPRIANPKNQLMMLVSPHDHDPTYGTLAGWIRFPSLVPRSVLLVGLRTPIDGGKMGTGDELFMTICALKAAGVENMLISRWAVGGESTAVLLRELLQELPFGGMNDAWERARMMLRRSELDPQAEPLLTKADHEQEGLTGDQPLFWAGYIVSTPPSTDQPPTDQPAE